MEERSADRVADYVAFCLRSERDFEQAKRVSSAQRLAGSLHRLYRGIARSVRLKQRPAKSTRDSFDLSRETRVTADGRLTLKRFDPWAPAASTSAKRPRVLLEATNTLRYGHTNGIQRVVRELAKSIVASGDGVPVMLDSGRLFAVDIATGELDAIDFRQGDVLFLADTTWIFEEDSVGRIIGDIQRQKGSVVLCVYDIIPLLYPSFFTDDLANAFKVSLLRLLPLLDGIATNSRSSVDAIATYLAGHVAPEQARIPLGYFHLGADLPNPRAGAPNPTLVRKLAATAYILCVGTVEPRKGHLVALRAFERLWARGVDVSLVIMGGKGWKMSFLEHQLATHREFDRRLYRFDDVSDGDLIFAYRHAVAVVMPTVAEGFGLPVVEAAALGAPVIVSDIPVLREIGGDALYYFDPLDDAHLADRVEEVFRTEAPRRKVLSGALGWREASAGFLDAVSSVVNESSGTSPSHSARNL